MKTIKNREYFSRIATTHGLTNHRFYKVWEGMKKRCYNPNQYSYKSYGARGIYICDEWLHDAPIFIAWAEKQLHAGEKGYTLDRIDNDGPYSPENCKFSTKKEQVSNSTRNIWIEHEGQTWLKEDFLQKFAKVCIPSVYKRISKGWDIKKAALTPARKA